MIASACAAPVVSRTDVVHDKDVRDCNARLFDQLGALDVAILIDTSQSTRRPSGYDIDQDGAIYRFSRDNAVDRGDSWLAAQIAAIRPLLQNAEGRDIRFSIITYAGSTIERTRGRTMQTGLRRDAKVRAELTTDLAVLESILNDVLERGSDGQTIFFAGMQRGMRSLISDPSRGRRRVALLISDSSVPMSIDLDGRHERVDRRMMHAAVVAQRQQIVFHTFGLSPESLDWRDEALGQIAGATGGTYHPVEDPRYFYCHMATALLPPVSSWSRLSNLAHVEENRPSEPDREATPDERWVRH